jgi:hypothetical protein
MSKVILDAATLAKLAGRSGIVQLCDEAGNLVGHYLPPPTPEGTNPEGGWGPFTAEEVARARSQSAPGRPLFEIMKDFGHL